MYLLLHYPQGNERTGDIRSSWVDVTTDAGSILLRLGRATKMAVFWSYFRDFVGPQKIADLSESKNFLQKYFQKRWIRFRRKNILGLGALSLKFGLLINAL